MGDGDKPSKIEAVPLTDDNNLFHFMHYKRKLFVGGLSPNTKKDDLIKYFEQWGKVTHAAVKTDRMNNEPRGFGFVVMDSEESVTKILAQKDHYIHNKRIDPKHARPSKDIRRKVFVGGLDPDIEEDKVREYFGKFGVIEIFEFPYDTHKSKRRPFAFITYATNIEAKAAVKQEKHLIEGKKCEVRIATPPEMLRSRKWAINEYNQIMNMYGNFPHGSYLGPGAYWGMPSPFHPGMMHPGPYGPYYPYPMWYDPYAAGQNAPHGPGQYGHGTPNSSGNIPSSSYYSGITPSGVAGGPHSRGTSNGGIPAPPPGSGVPSSGGVAAWGGQPLPQQAGYRGSLRQAPLSNAQYRTNSGAVTNGPRSKHS